MKYRAQITVELVDGGAVVTYSRPAEGPNPAESTSRVVSSLEELKGYLEWAWHQYPDESGG